MNCKMLKMSKARNKSKNRGNRALNVNINTCKYLKSADFLFTYLSIVM